jgi:hypothetical protein
MRIQIRIKENAFIQFAKKVNRRCGAQGCWAEHENRFYTMLKVIDGAWVEVETEYLFTDQFNTVPIPGVTDLGMGLTPSEKLLGRAVCPCESNCGGRYFTTCLNQGGRDHQRRVLPAPCFHQ